MLCIITYGFEQHESIAPISFTLNSQNDCFKID